MKRFLAMSARASCHRASYINRITQANGSLATRENQLLAFAADI
ncbi:hypothetical protein [Bythopirellula polymerisocia]|nr:hypothetical protein [Bythopirellula polymerisocia]